MAFPCLVAFIVFFFLSFFSVKYKKYAAASLKCFFNVIQFRKCETKIDEELKSEIVSFLLPRSKTLAKIVFKHFELLSTFFVVLFFLSGIFSLFSIYNIFVYGSCSGENGQSCSLLDINQMNQEINSNKIIIKKKGLSFNPANFNETLFIYGCFLCPHNAEVEPIIEKIVSEYSDRIEIIYKPFPFDPNNKAAITLANAMWCSYENGLENYLKFRKLILKSREWEHNESYFLLLAEKSGINVDEFKACMNSYRYMEEINQTIREARSLGLSSPSFVFKEKKLIGKVSYEELKKFIEEGLNDR